MRERSHSLRWIGVPPRSEPPMRARPRIRRTLIYLSLAALAAALPLAIAAPAPPAAAAIGGLTWSDEFNGAAGTSPDPAKWKFDIGGHGWGNNERQYYTNTTRNAAHDG